MATSDERPQASSPPPIAAANSCLPYVDIQRLRTTNFTDYLNTTVSVSPKRPSADVPTGGWIQGMLQL